MKESAFICLVIVAMPLSFAAADDKAQKNKTSKQSKEANYDDRFDLEVREDIFAGFQGDKERMAKGLETCEIVLKKNPKHPEALVWRGSIRVFKAGQFFSQGNVIQGMQNWTSGLQDMDKAKELAPNHIGVLIPRAAVLLPAGKSAPKAMGMPLLKRVREDFEGAYARQKDFLDELGEHPYGELRMGLADVYRALGKTEESKQQLEALVNERPDSKYAEIAQEWMKAPVKKKLSHSCVGCHNG